ncbi:hypothetical protein PoB_003437100 [Plakobranchus ocellatus]|uniref:Uncharacterized protein n=1 Tax=Plakobranchus ocellatus TaxID=259542 RepID=A0AAV4AHR5_9GAST|nr:hypothetical protein PoB_003437100 [Plakobranchus ocellatus]
MRCLIITLPKRDKANEGEVNSCKEEVRRANLNMTRCNWFHTGVFLPVVIAVSLSMVRTSDGQRQNDTALMFNGFYSIVFSPETLSRFLKCLCTATTSTCQQDYKFTSALYYTTYMNVRSENISASEEAGNTFRCHPGAFTTIMAFIGCVRSSDSSVLCEKEHFCQPYFVSLDYEGCDSKCINIWWVAREVEITNVAGHPAFVAGSCELSGSSPSAGNNDAGNNDSNNDGNNDAGNNDDNNDADNNDANNDSNNDGNKDAGNNYGKNDSNNGADTKGLMVAAAVGWLFFGLLASTNLAFLYCWRCRKTFLIHRINQSEQKNTKFVASQNRSPPSGHGEGLPTSQHGRENVNKNNGHSNEYTDYNEANDEYTVIDDEIMPNVKKETTKTNGVEPAYKNIVTHSPHQMSDDNNLTTISGHLPMTITSGDVSKRNKLSIEGAEACARQETGRSAADSQMSRGAMLIYDIPSGTLVNNDKGGVDPKGSGRAEDAVNKSVHPYNLAPAVHDEQDESASHHYKSPPMRNTEALEV